MPKGKAKKDNPDLYQGSPEPQEPNMAPQAMAHRRGGKHRVKSADLTNSKYDEFSYAEVLQLAKERNIYRKDMKKKEMAMANKQFDADEHSRQRAAVIDQKKREQERRRIQQQKDDEKQAAIRAKHLRAMEKEKQRAEGEEVSDESLDEDDIDAEHERLIDGDEYKQENVGQLLSDDSWDSTSTESSISTETQTIEPDCRLRLYEWPEWPQGRTMLSTNLGATSDSVTASDSDSDEWHRVKVPYAPIKVITTKSKQKLFLPGQTYPPGIQPDFVPTLSQHTRNAAHNGVLLGVLRKATIERASEWATRTQIQSATAMIFLSLPPRNEAKNLAETYDKWYLENRKLLRVKARGDGASANRTKRHTQRFRNKAKKFVEIYEASQYRPLAVCYVPSYLDYDKRHGGTEKRIDGHWGLDKLFYIRFPGCDLPHYYFWARPGEWSDPTVHNPNWDATRVQQNLSPPSACAHISFNPQNSDYRHVRSHSRKRPMASSLHSWARVQNPYATPPIPSASSSAFETALATIEHKLYTNGLALTLSYYRKKWLASNKHSAWQEFTRLLPSLYPSGTMPRVPPAIGATTEHSLAFKIATIDTLDHNESTPLLPFQGDEAWTQNDDAYWDLVQPPTTEPDIHDQLERRCETDVEPDALYRRASIIPNHHVDPDQCTDSNNFSKWLSQISPVYGPWPVPGIPSTPGFDEWKRHGPGVVGRNQDMQRVDEQVETQCPFCTLNWTGMSAAKRAAHMWSHASGHSSFTAPTRVLGNPYTPPTTPLPPGSHALYPIFINDTTIPLNQILTALHRRKSASTLSHSLPSSPAPTPSDSRPRKRRKLENPMYVEPRVSDEEDESVWRRSVEMPARKRRRVGGRGVGGGCDDGDGDGGGGKRMRMGAVARGWGEGGLRKGCGDGDGDGGRKRKRSRDRDGVEDRVCKKVKSVVRTNGEREEGGEVVKWCVVM
ncbi:hypothetical protein NX059_004622 [Plenodomus lindquistii]|nr:hypothetical protein NX059_004622 [Plenodomus lindquistii]